MEIVSLDCRHLSPADMAALLEITGDFCRTSTSWAKLCPLLERGEAWAFYERAKLIGYAIARPCSPQLQEAVSLTHFRYGWEVNEEASLRQMLVLLSAQYSGKYRFFLLEVNRLREINMEFYHKIGFCNSTLPSLKGEGYIVLLAELNRFPTQSEKT